MKRWLVVLAFGHAAAAGNVIEWGGAGGRGTFAQLTIDSHGVVTATFGDGRTVQKRTGRVTKAELAKLDDLLAKHHACALKPDPNYVPVPEEHHTKLVALLPKTKCTVELHQNEWGKSPDGKAIEAALEAIDAKLK